MVAFPPCKINLGLNVLSKRPDGYHNLETCFYPIPYTDILEIILSTKFSFTATGSSIAGSITDNLCIRAYELLKKDFELSPVEIHLHKIIPMGAGLGGGSADAAFTLRLLNNIFELGLSTPQLIHHAKQLGSDCAFFIEDKPKLGLGRGEVLEPINISLKGKFLVLLKPDVHVSTADAYKGIIPKIPEPSARSIVENTALIEWKNILRNDFEESVFKQYPIIQRYKTRLYDAGATYSSMSGSGSSVFGIFDSPIDVQQSFTKDVIWSGVVNY